MLVCATALLKDLILGWTDRKQVGMFSREIELETNLRISFQNSFENTFEFTRLIYSNFWMLHMSKSNSS
jgi:hypothetical protein